RVELGHDSSEARELPRCVRPFRCQTRGTLRFQAAQNSDEGSGNCAQSAENRVRREECTSVFAGAEGIWRVRFLCLEFRWRQAEVECVAKLEGSAATNRRVGCA